VLVELLRPNRLTLAFAFAVALLFGLGLVGHTGNRSLGLFALPGCLLIPRAATSRRGRGRRARVSAAALGSVLVAPALLALAGGVNGP
jgi:hypothetical protein